MEDLRFAAILHDIGKIHVSENVLLKEGPLNDQEWEEIKKHPIIGSEMVRNVPYLISAIPAIRHHHERWDGQGYPDRLAGESIPLNGFTYRSPTFTEMEVPVPKLQSVLPGSKQA